MAKTKNQIEVANLSMFLPRMKPSEELEAMRAYAQIYVGKQSAWCSCCGHEWHSDLWDNRRIRKGVCPHCGVHASVKRSSGKRVHRDKWYWSMVKVVEGWQVVRNYFCKVTIRKGEKKNAFSCNEVSQVWMKPGCKTVFMGRSVRGACGYVDAWKMNTPISLKYDHYRYRYSGPVGQQVELIPVVRRNGLNRLRKGIGVVEQLEAIIEDPRAEIIAKAKQWNVFDYYCLQAYAVRSRWDSLRIAMRHKYVIRDAGLWLDYVDELRRQGKDICNPKFICPAALMKAHDELLVAKWRRQKQQEEERLRREKEKLLRESEELSAEYRRRMKDFLDIRVAHGRIVLRPLQDLYDFFVEGNELHHCVYRNKYYEKEDCLIIGAKVNGKRMETIELNMKSGKIIQCRGKYNKNSKYHQSIYKLMEQNINKFINVG